MFAILNIAMVYGRN